MKINKTSLQDTLNNPEELIRLRNAKRPLNKRAAPFNSVEEDLANWLGRLKLLHGVPFNYLVPDVEMLPMESIKFFYCDTVWLAYLAEGALSLGRSATPDSVHDKAFLPDLELYSRKAMKTERGNVLGHLLGHLHPAEAALLSTAPIPLNEKITGFLLRSGVVSDWEGLQVEAFAENNLTKPCQLLRMDHLSPNVLFCMYEGEVKSIRINEHPEVLHFGVDNKLNSKEIPRLYTKSFRYPDNKKTPHRAGEQVEDEGVKPIEINTHLRGTDSRVLRINKLAEDIKTTLAKPEIGYTDSFTSAEFALEMVEGAEAVKFILA